jgi:long-chain fatty acid transport protein
MTSTAFALGGANIGNEVPSARSAGQGYVGTAGQNNDPTAVWSNPGAITKLQGTQVTVGSHLENIRGSYESDSGAETRARVLNVGIPNFAVTQSFLDGKLGAGLTVQSPFGLETNWPGDSPLRYVATNSRIATLFVSPAIAYRLHNTVAVGVGVDYVNLFRAQLDRHLNVDAVNTGLQALGLGTASAGSSDAISSLRGQAANWGYHAGVVYEPSDMHAVGLTYHSKVNLRINGSVKLSGMSGSMAGYFGGSDYETSAYTDLVLPQNLQLGYAFKPTSKWIFEADAAWYHWSDNRDLRVRFSETNPIRTSVLETGNPSALNLRDAWSVAAGFNFHATDRWQLRSGFWYEPWATPESSFNPAFLDLSRYALAFGTGYDLTKYLTVDLAYSAVFFHNRHIHNDVGTNTSGIIAPLQLANPAIPSADIDGTYKDFANIFAVNLTYKFGI